MASVAEQRQAEVGRREPLLKVEHLSKTFKVGGQILRAVDDVTFRIPRGTTLSVVGESGSGKSTLARCILGMLPFDEGSVIYDGASLSTLRSREMRRMREHIQVVFQDPHGSLNRRLPALALEPEFIVLDEAVSALDVSVRAQVLNLLRRLQDDMSLTYLFITHDLSVARYMAEEVVVMYQGRFVEEGTRSELFDDPRHPYTHRLMDAVATVDPMRRVVRRVALPTSDVGDLLQASGCRFHPRCPIGRELSECQQVDPVATSIDASHLIRCHHPQTVVQWRDIAKAIKE
jgi:peptide/nickel transport system ATP-binding protein